MSGRLVLSFNGEVRDAPAAGPLARWKVRGIDVSPAARGMAAARNEVELAPGDVVEIVLQDGTALLVPAEDAPRYLGAPMARDTVRGAEGRGDDSDGRDPAAVLRVGAGLRIAGPLAPDGAARDSAGAWLLKSLHIYNTAADVVANEAAGAFERRQLEGRTGFCRLSTSEWSVSPPQADIASAGAEGPILLFIHGTASSCEGSFRGLWDTGVSASFAKTYEDRVYAFEHCSLTRSPIDNALEIARGLSPGARLHLVSHSRGGMIGELLARANRVDAPEPFTEDEVAAFAAASRARIDERDDAEIVSLRPVYNSDAERLRELSALLRERGVRVEKFVRVAATARGTTLASGRLDRWASVMLSLAGKGLMVIPGLQPAGAVYPYFKDFLLAVVKKRTDARVLPGLEAMMPDSPLVALLNAPGVRVDSPVHVVAGDFEGGNLLQWLGDCFSESFFGGATDLVVNTPSMSGGAMRPAIFVKALAGPDVHHFSYFRRRDSAQPMLQALQGDDTAFAKIDAPSTASIARAARRGEEEERTDRPICLVLPGIMGTHLTADGRRVWMQPLRMIVGGMSELHFVPPADAVATDGWIEYYFQDFADRLSQTHAVRPFVYDWRDSIARAAQDFGRALDQAIRDAKERRVPLRIAAHSMGGLVARLALQDRWAGFAEIEGSRFVQFGTPNGGSHSIAAVLTGRDAFVQMIDRWMDWRHDMREFLDIVRRFPGVLELLPWSGDLALGHATNYFDAGLWNAWAQADDENRRVRGAAAAWQNAPGAGHGWILPEAAELAAAESVVRRIQAAPLDPDRTFYVAGRAPTPVAIRFEEGRMEIGWSPEGDGRVPYATGIPHGVRAWYVDAAHGDLMRHAKAFDEYVNLLQTGQCALSPTPGAARGEDGVVFAPAALERTPLYPTEAEVLAAAMGAQRPTSPTESAPAKTVVTVEIVHGSLANSTLPVMIGAYANDSLRGSGRYVDKLFGGALQWATSLGCYPGEVGEVTLFHQKRDDAEPACAIVIGLGLLGQLEPGELTRAFRHGLLEHVRRLARPGGEPMAVGLSTLLAGTGFGGLTVDVGMRCLFEAILGANDALEGAGIPARIARVVVHEEEEGRVIAAAGAGLALAKTESFAGRVAFNARLQVARGAFRAATSDQTGSRGWHRVHITAGEDGALSFTLVTQQARNDVRQEQDQRQVVGGLLGSAVASTVDQPGLSRALFELLVPNGLKQAVPDVDGLILGVDLEAAAYPWELMRDEPESSAGPLVTRVCLVRQLATPYGDSAVAAATGNAALVIGDTQSGYDPLPGAQQEARVVESALKKSGFGIAPMESRPAAQSVLLQLFDTPCRVLHIAAHGYVSEDGRVAGIVLGKDTYLTPAQIGKLPRVPEFVFINCCHLGNMAPEAHRGRLAANVATKFIEMGCRAVVAAGWAVDDGAARTFASALYRELLAGVPFGAALRIARQETWRRHPACNTWGAYQAYGDEQYRLLAARSDDWSPAAYVHPSQAVGEIRLLLARVDAGFEDELETYYERLVKVEEAALRSFGHVAEVREALADLSAKLGDLPRAIDHYRAAVALVAGSASLDAVEQLAKIEVRLGAETCRAGGEGMPLVHSGFERLRLLMALRTGGEPAAAAQPQAIPIEGRTIHIRTAPGDKPRPRLEPLQYIYEQVRGRSVDERWLLTVATTKSEHPQVQKEARKLAKELRARR